RRFYDRPHEDQILDTFGLSIILVEIVRSIYGGVSVSVTPPDWGIGIVKLGSLIYPMYRMQTLAIAAATLLVLYFILYRTSLGLVVRAGIADANMVDALGIDIRRALLMVVGLGPMAAGIAGVVISPSGAVTPGG